MNINEAYKNKKSSIFIFLIFALSTFSSFAFSQEREWKILPPWRSPAKMGMPGLFAKELSQELDFPVSVDESIGKSY